MRDAIKAAAFVAEYSQRLIEGWDRADAAASALRNAQEYVDAWVSATLPTPDVPARAKRFWLTSAELLLAAESLESAAAAADAADAADAAAAEALCGTAAAMRDIAHAVSRAGDMNVLIKRRFNS